MTTKEFIAGLHLLGASKYTDFSDTYNIKINGFVLNIRVTTNLVFYRSQVYLKKQYQEVLAKIAQDCHDLK